MKRTGRYLAALVLLIASQAMGQGSSYNLIGFGEPLVTRQARLEGSGGTGAGLAEPRLINDLNPAAWSWLARARFESGFRFDRVSATQNALSSTSSDFRFEGISFGSPLGTEYKIGASIGFSPLTDASNKLVQVDSSFTRTYESQGGLSIAYIGLSIMPTSGLALGGKFDVLFGNIRRMAFLDVGSDQEAVAGQFQRDYAMTGIRGTLGLLLHGDSIGISGLTAGVAYSTSSSLTTKRRTIVTALAQVNDTTIEESGDGFYPGAIAAGLTYSLDRRYRILGDVRLQDFSTAYVYAPENGIGDPSLQASTRMSVGFERLPNLGGEFGSGGGLSKLGLRLGAFFGTLPFSPTGSGGVTEIGGSLGVGIPMTQESMIDLSLTAGQRTPTNANASPSDFFIRAGMSIGLAEKWFVPTRRDD